MHSQKSTALISYFNNKLKMARTYLGEDFFEQRSSIFDLSPKKDILIFLLSILVFLALGFNHWPFILLIFILSRLSPFLIILFFNILMLFLNSFAFKVSEFKLLFPSITFNFYIIATKFIVISILFFAVYLLDKKYFLIALAFLVGILSYTFTADGGYLRGILVSTLLLASTYGLYIFYFFIKRLQSNDKKNPFFLDLLFAFPFWGLHIPILGSLNDLKSNFEKNPEQRLELAKNGFRQLYLAVALLCISDLILGLFLPAFKQSPIVLLNLPALFPLPVTYGLSHKQYFENYGWIQAVGVVLLRFLALFFMIIAWYILQIGLLRILGFKAQNSFENPLRSTSLFNYYKKIQVYYSTYLIEIVIWPLFIFFSRFFRQSQRLFLSVFLGTFVLGITVRVFENMFFLLSNNISFIEKIGFILRLMGFYGFLSVAIAVSALLSLKRPPNSNSSLLNFTKFSLYFLFHAIITYFLLFESVYVFSTYLVSPTSKF